MVPPFSKADLNKFRHDAQNEVTLICAKFGKDLFSISKVIGRETNWPRFFAYPVCYRASVRPSVTRMNQSKTVEVRIMQLSPYGSPIPLVFAGLVSPRNSDGFHLSGGVKRGGVGKTRSHFLALFVNISKTVAYASIFTK